HFEAKFSGRYFGNAMSPYPVSTSCPCGPRSRADWRRMSRTWRAVQSGWRDQSKAARPAAWGAAAEGPLEGRRRHRLGNGSDGTRSGLGREELGREEL